jgi:very-short-patch-repair endonuclease
MNLGLGTTDGRVMRNVDGVPRPPKRTRSLRSRADPAKKEFARKLRNSPTKAYDLLWRRLRSKKLGVRFRRRAIIYGWIPDFWCPAARLVIEIDYPTDSQRDAEHSERDKALAQMEVEVLRVASERIYSDADQVAREIGAIVRARC